MNIKKINILCRNCNTNMEIQTKYLKNKNSLCCINCEQEFPQQTFEKLKDSIQKFEEIRKELEYQDSMNQTCINFSVSIISE